MKKLLIIKDRNKTVYIRNRKVRTPCTVEVTDKEIVNLKKILKMTGIEHFSVKSLDIKEDAISFDFKDKEVVIEELDVVNEESEKPKTILEKLMNGDSQ